MKPIIVTYSNESYVLFGSFGASYIARHLISQIYDLISNKDIKLIARPKKTNR